MPRDLVLGNGRLLVTFDDTYTLRDFYFPHVGMENHTIGHPCRTGIWADGQFAWFSDAGWARHIQYRKDSLVTDVTLEHKGLAVRLRGQDAVHFSHPLLFRWLEVTNLAKRRREIRLLFHQDFHISESAMGDTAGYEPVNRYLIHYKGHRYFLVNGRAGQGEGIFQYATGVKEVGVLEGTWRDAEDGVLEMNPMAQGSVDSAVSFAQSVEAGASASFEFWIAAARDYWEAKALNALVLEHAGPRGDAAEPGAPTRVQAMLAETDAAWRRWVCRATQELADLPDGVRALYRRSLLVIRTQMDDDGAILAANDGDSLLFNRDTYSYMWPRDGALVARTLDRSGYTDLTERFFRFCARLMPKPSYYPEGYLLHKYNPDGSVGSSWHPWVRDGRPSLAVQEDETALVLWAFWRHVEARLSVDPEVLGLVRELAPRLVIPAAHFLLLYRDEQEGRARFDFPYGHEPTGLPLPSYDLWEERYGVHAFTVVATCAGLEACRKLIELAVEQGWADEEKWCDEAYLCARDAGDPVSRRNQMSQVARRCREGSGKMKAAFQSHFWSPRSRSFSRMLNFEAGGKVQRDDTFDASTLYALLAFGVFEPDEPGVRETIESVEKRLWCRTPIGGLARYEGDAYYRQSRETEAIPGNPWVLCTLWAALGRLFLARHPDDLVRPREILQWACEHARPSGVLAEQVHPLTGVPMSVSPLTWSHAAFVETVLAYVEKHSALNRVSNGSHVPRDTPSCPRHDDSP
ncbi:MAG: glycoside hydrolase family 15 protein [Planctomycetes bacterium]|nr:glycoside hydrolase family 15 protein [Planctomycetota bacterium]